MHPWGQLEGATKRQITLNLQCNTAEKHQLFLALDREGLNGKQSCV